MTGDDSAGAGVWPPRCVRLLSIPQQMQASITSAAGAALPRPAGHSSRTLAVHTRTTAHHVQAPRSSPRANGNTAPAAPRYALIDGFTPAQSTLVKGLVAGAFNLALGLWFERNVLLASNLGAALLLGALSYGLSLVLHIAGGQHLGAARAQTIFGTAPFWGVVVSWTILAEPRSAGQVLAGALMGGALWLMRNEQHGHAHAHMTVVHTHSHRHDDGHHEHGHAEGPVSLWHTHGQAHEAAAHVHDHTPDLHHRHAH